VNQDDQVSPERAAYDMRAAALVGRRVLQVEYWDVHNFADEPATWDYGDWHHAVMGVDLLTDTGPSCVLWTATFFPYGVEIFPTPVSDHVVNGEDGPEPRDVSGSDRWQVRLSSPVRNVATFWERFTIGPSYLRDVRVADSYEVDVPVALRLDFAAGPVWMVAGIPQAPQMREVFVPGDEIMVVFATDRMRQIGFPDSEFLAASRR
jgi:hypothetical protein